MEGINARLDSAYSLNYLTGVGGVLLGKLSAKSVFGVGGSANGTKKLSIIGMGGQRIRI